MNTHTTSIIGTYKKLPSLTSCMKAYVWLGILVFFLEMVWSVPLAPAAQAFYFNPKIGGRSISLPESQGKYWTLSGFDTEYKNRILKDFQDMLTKREIPQTEQRWYVSQIYAENGSLASHVVGDHGCSFGILQYNACARNGMNAKKFLEKNPEWKETHFQLQAMADEIVFRRSKYNGSIRRTVLGHNCPACANGGGLDSKAGYVSNIERKLSLFSLNSL